MKKSVMKKWVKALRSGDYLQGKDYLATVNGLGEHEFCCLGVLCNIFQEETGKLNVKETTINTYFKSYHMKKAGYEFNSEDATLPNIVKEYAEMKNNSGTYGWISLTELNDTGHTFSEIADVIEENWESL